MIRPLHFFSNGTSAMPVFHEGTRELDHLQREARLCRAAGSDDIADHIDRRAFEFVDENGPFVEPRRTFGVYSGGVQG